MALTNKFSLVALALAAGLVAAPAAFAQDDQQPAQSAPAEQSDQPAAIEPTGEQVDSFVNATVRIIAIQRDAQQEIMAAEKQEEQKQLRDEALQMIVAAVEEEGLSVDEYNGIVEKVESDPEFGETVQQRIQEQVAE